MTQERAKKVIWFAPSIRVSELAQQMGIQVSQLIKKLMSIGVMATVNQSLDIPTANLAAKDFGFVLEATPPAKPKPIREPKKKPGQPAKKGAVRQKRLVGRPPVVTIMGHVDHGKTMLLDAIRKSNIIAKEHGGITQHIGAYQVKLPKGNITFIDTPGHEAFTRMRARGAQITDVVVLVIAADDGIMPQTGEAIDHARAAGVPIVVAINKIDLPNVNPDRVKEQLRKYDLVPEEMGGKTICCEVSAKEKTGLDHLLDMLLLEAEMLELKANPTQPAYGTVIEARLDRGRGSVATALVKNGSLRVGDPLIAGPHYGKVRALIDDRGMPVDEALPSMPVEVLGLSGIPQPGDLFQVVGSEKEARQIGIERQEAGRAEELARPPRVTLNTLYQQIEEGRIEELSLVVKGDVRGSVEALSDSLEDLSTKDVRLNIIHRGVGTINESDVMLASASNAICIGFHTLPEPGAQDLAKREGVDTRTYRVIYEAIDDVKAAMVGLLKPQYEEVVLGKAEVRQVFSVAKRKVAGSYVIEGKIVRNASCKLLRGEESIYEGRIASLRRFKEDIREVATGFECGIGLENFDDLQVGDIIITFEKKEIERQA